MKMTYDDVVEALIIDADYDEPEDISLLLAMIVKVTKVPNRS